MRAMIVMCGLSYLRQHEVTAVDDPIVQILIVLLMLAAIINDFMDLFKGWK